MITEDYCSHEISRLLKEKGFDEKCPSYYRVQDSKIDLLWNHFEGKLISNSELNQYFVSAPTHQMALKWLRCKGIYIEIDVLGKTNIKYGFTILKLNEGEIYSDDKTYTTFEEAVEAALKYCLTKVI